MTNAPRVPVPPSKPLPTSARCLWLHVRLPHLWWSLPVRSRLGPSASGFVGPSRAFAWIEDDSRRPRLARLPGSEAVVNGAPQSCDGAGGRRRTGLVCRAECLSQEKLPVRVFLPRFPHPDHSTAGRLA